MNPFSRATYFFHRLFSGLRYWCQDRFTPTGLGVLCALTVTAIMAPDTENNVAYQAVSLLICMLAIAVTFSVWVGASFAATRILPRFATAGSPFRYTLHVTNSTRKKQNGLSVIEQTPEGRGSFDLWKQSRKAEQRQLRSFRVSTKRGRASGIGPLKEYSVPTALPQEEVKVEVELTPLRRGVLHFKGIRLARPDPLGLFRAFCRVQLPQTTLVLPRRYPLPPIRFPGTLKYQKGGVALASNVGQSEEFISLRDYRYGDPLRHIHWRSWAKAGRPVVKEFEDEFFLRHALILDTFTDLPQSELFEEAVSVAASFACGIQTQESLLDLLFVGPESYCFTAGRGLAHTDQMLEILASVRTCGAERFGALEHLVCNHISEVSGCICVLIAWDEQRRQFVEKMVRLGVPVLVLVISEPGPREPLNPGPMLSPATLKILRLGRIEQDLAALGI